MEKIALKEEGTKQYLEALLEEKGKTKKLEQKLLLYAKEVAKLREEIKSSSQKLQGTIDENQLLRANDEVEFLTSLYQELKLQHEKTLARMQESEDETGALRQQQKTLKNIIHAAQEKAESNQSKLSNALQALEQLKQEHAELQSLRNKIDHAESELNASRDAITQMEVKLSDANEQSRQHRQEIDALTTSLYQREKRLAQLEKYEQSHVQAIEKVHHYEKELENERRNTVTFQLENETLKQSLNDGKQHGQQLERVIQFLRERSEEAQLEKKQLEEEFLSAQEAVNTLKEQLKCAKNEWKDLSEHFSGEQQAKQEAIDELVAVQNQFADLKNKVADTQTLLNQRDQLLREAQKKIHALKEERAKFENLVKDQSTLEREIADIEKSKEAAAAQTKALQEKLEAQTKELEAAKQQLSDAKTSSQQQREVAKSLEEALTATQERLHRIEKERQELNDKEDKQRRTIHDLKASLAAREATHQTETLEDKEQIASLKEQLEAAAQAHLEKERLSNQLELLKKEQEQLNNQFHETQRAHQEKKAQYELELQFKAQLHAEKDVLERQLVEVKKEYLHTTQRFEELLQAHHENKNQYEQQQKVKERLEKDNEELIGRLQSTHNALLEHQVKVNDLSAALERETAKRQEEGLLKERIVKENELNIQQLTLQLSKTHEDLVEANRRLEEALNAHADVEGKFNTLQEASHQKEKVIEECKLKIGSLNKEKSLLEEAVLKNKKKADESDSTAQIAQQHLAKKVKETTILSEKLEEQRNQMYEVRSALVNAQNRSAELQNNLESLVKDKQRLEDKLHESIGNAEAHARKWEEKYEKIYSQWKEADLQNQELRRQKEKLDRLQQMLSGIESVISSQQPMPQPQYIPTQQQMFQPQGHQKPQYQPQETFVSSQPSLSLPQQPVVVLPQEVEQPPKAHLNHPEDHYHQSPHQPENISQELHQNASPLPLQQESAQPPLQQMLPPQLQHQQQKQQLQEEPKAPMKPESNIDQRELLTHTAAKTPTEKQGPYQNLFDLNKHQLKQKQNLFDE